MEKALLEQYMIVGMAVSVEKSWHTVIGEVRIETGKTNKISRESISRLSPNRRDHLWNSSALDLDFSPQVSSHFLLYPPPHSGCNPIPSFRKNYPFCRNKL